MTLSAPDLRARVAQFRAIATLASAEFKELLQAAMVAKDGAEKQRFAALADLAACRARRHKQWAESYEELALDIEEP